MINKSVSIFLGLIFILAITTVEAESPVRMAKQFGCSMDHKIEIKEMISSCKCHDESSCVWTKGRKPVMGCPCPVPPPANTDYDSIITAEIVNCSDKKIEIDKKFGQCECEGGGQCIFAGRKTIAGCPCAGGRQPVESDYADVKPMRKGGKKRRNRKSENVETTDL